MIIILRVVRGPVELSCRTVLRDVQKEARNMLILEGDVVKQR